MLLRLGIFIFLVVLSKCSAAFCKTCRGEECQKGNIKFEECTEFSSIFLHETYENYHQKIKGKLRYGCLKLEHPYGQSYEIIEQCVITENLNNVCRKLARRIFYTTCTIQPPVESLVIIMEKSERIPVTEPETEPSKVFSTITGTSDFFFETTTSPAYSSDFTSSEENLQEPSVSTIKTSPTMRTSEKTFESTTEDSFSTKSETSLDLLEQTTVKSKVPETTLINEAEASNFAASQSEKGESSIMESITTSTQVFDENSSSASSSTALNVVDDENSDHDQTTITLFIFTGKEISETNSDVSNLTSTNENEDSTVDDNQTTVTPFVSTSKQISESNSDVPNLISTNENEDSTVDYHQTTTTPLVSTSKEIPEASTEVSYFTSTLAHDPSKPLATSTSSGTSAEESSSPAENVGPLNSSASGIGFSFHASTLVFFVLIFGNFRLY